MYLLYAGISTLTQSGAPQSGSPAASDTAASIPWEAITTAIGAVLAAMITTVVQVLSRYRDRERRAAQLIKTAKQLAPKLTPEQQDYADSVEAFLHNRLIKKAEALIKRDLWMGFMAVVSFVGVLLFLYLADTQPWWGYNMALGFLVIATFGFGVSTNWYQVDDRFKEFISNPFKWISSKFKKTPKSGSDTAGKDEVHTATSEQEEA